jgi:branched-chain amino acid transport system ATP-binding protein
MLGAPSPGLAPVLVERIGEILAEIQKAEGLAVLLAGQNANWALLAAELLNNEDVRMAYLGV